MKIASVCTLYPSRSKPHLGVFVQRRLEALARLAEVRLLKPLPWFPWLRRPGRFEPAAHAADEPVVHAQSMFYIPGVLKGIDGRWLQRAVQPVLEHWKDEDGFEVIDAHFGYPEGVGCVRAARQLGVPVFVTLRGSEASYLRDRWIGPQLVSALRACTGVIAVSHSLRQAAEEFGIDSAKVRVIPNAVDDAVFYPGPKEEARERVNEIARLTGKQLIISVGQLVHRKGHHTLLKAFALLRKQRPRVELAIVGGPAYERSYPQFLAGLARDLGIADAVRFIGPLPPGEVANWLRAADVFALATQREGCCNAILEALACGLPVVTTEAGDNAIYVDPPHNGRLVPMEDSETLAEALKQVLTDDWDAPAIANRVTGKGWSAVAEAVLDFFEERLSRTEHREGIREVAS
jgi:teichuronic acid biosynthesis glycosyltransferase TuaC